jgi:amidase
LGTTSEGLPIGVHLSALHGDERTLLELAYEIEEARPFTRIQD